MKEGKTIEFAQKLIISNIDSGVAIAETVWAKKWGAGVGRSVEIENELKPLRGMFENDKKKKFF